MKRPLPPGLIALHSNRAEVLAETVFAWLARNPLGPLESEIVLVQSNGMAEWLKMAMAAHDGICAAAAVQLPSRFLWQTYRHALGPAEVPAQSALDKAPMAWRLMRQLPDLVLEPGFEPVRQFLSPGGPERLWQLASRLADLFDQYQIYRPDWLSDWSGGRDVLRTANGAMLPVPYDQKWQPALWRAVLGGLDPDQRSGIRPEVHQRALAALLGTQGAAQPIPRRVMLFGMTHVPIPVLQILVGLARHSQVILAVPNPCRFHWADIMEGRDLLRMQYRRQPLRGGRDLAELPLDAMHAHAHPLLAAWGRQGRDFVRQLDDFDDAQQAMERFDMPRVDLFDEAEDSSNTSLLEQVQHRIRDLVPLTEHPPRAVASTDRSIVFHVAHTALREIEILHDQLLQMLDTAQADGQRVEPRDIVVMVPAIDTFAPAIRAVFGQFHRHEARFIPFGIADMNARGVSPLLAALDWVLRLPEERVRRSELRDLLEVPAVAARFRIDDQGMARLAQWMEGAGIRWGLNASQRADLGLDACGNQNTAEFGLQRMLLGYASGATAFDDVEPYSEVGGLEAESAGGLARLLLRLEVWRTQASAPASPMAWANAFRSLLEDLFQATDETDREMLAALDAALGRWQEVCDRAGFDDQVPLAVARQAWMDAVEEPSLNQRFRAGGVTFCTLMPMRAIPFQVVCLLGMNDGDYPRRVPRSDFDLMGQSGQVRPGDRSRQSDDRQLMLEALLSARRTLYVSWTGHSVRDNSPQPPSVLVAQLRDYLAAGWQGDVLAARTTVHPLQPFSRRYFEGRSDLWTYAREWQGAHRAEGPPAQAPVHGPNRNGPVPSRAPLTVERLARFLRHPVKTFFRERLGIVFDAGPADAGDDESFGLAGLEQHGVLQTLLDGAIADLERDRSSHVPTLLAQRLVTLERSGQLPLGGLAQRTLDQLSAELLPMLQHWRALQEQHTQHAARVPLTVSAGSPPTLQLSDWLDALYVGPDGGLVWMGCVPSQLLHGERKRGLRAHSLVLPWVRSLAAAASGVQVRGVLVGRDASLHLPAMDPQEARGMWQVLVDTWEQGAQEPLPLPLRTALAYVQGGDPAATYEGGFRMEGEVAEPCLARAYPDFEALTADGRFSLLARSVAGPLAQWSQSQVVVAMHADTTLHGASSAEDTV